MAGCFGFHVALLVIEYLECAKVETACGNMLFYSGFLGDNG